MQPSLTPDTTRDGTNLLRPAVTLFIILSVFTGVIYPLLITVIAQVAFPQAANGSLIRQGDKILGSHLIGQAFTGPGHFWSRPSATSPLPYNAAASTGSNLGPTNPGLLSAVQARIAALHMVDPNNTKPIPADLVTTSASGLDPHISRAAADYQAPRIARLRSLPESTVQALIATHTEQRWAGFLGEPRVNVLQLNLALEALVP